MPTTAAPSAPARRHRFVEIGEIADAPIARAAQPVELRRQTPAARARTQPFRQMARSRRDDQVDLRLRASRRERQAVIARAAIRPADAACHRRRGRPCSPPSSSRKRHSTPSRGPRPGRARQHRGGVVRVEDVDRGEAERRSFRSVGERFGGLLRVGGQAERRDQPGQCLFVRPRARRRAHRHDGRDTEQAGDAAQGLGRLIASRRRRIGRQIEGGAGRCDARRPAAPGSVQYSSVVTGRPIAERHRRIAEIGEQQQKRAVAERPFARSAAGPSRRNAPPGPMPARRGTIASRRTRSIRR